jgi:hypothetical protein
VEKGSETGAALSPAAQTQQTLSVWFQPSGVLYTALAVLIVTLVLDPARGHHFRIKRTRIGRLA